MHSRCDSHYCTSMAPVPAAMSFSGFSTNKVRGPAAAVAGTCSVKCRIPRPRGSRLLMVMSGVGGSADRKREGRIERAHGKNAQVRGSGSRGGPLDDHRAPAEHAGRCRRGVGSDRGDVQTHISRGARSAVRAEFHHHDVISGARWVRPASAESARPRAWSQHDERLHIGKRSVGILQLHSEDFPRIAGRTR